MSGVSSLLSKLGQIVPPPNWEQTVSLFGLTTGRCGTTTLTRLMQISPDIHATHEPPPHVRNPLRTRPYYLPTLHDAELQRTFQDFRAWTLWRMQTKGLRYVELNGMKFYAATIAEMMPASQFVFIHRHPAEFVRSGMRRQWYVGHKADGNRLTPRDNDPASAEWPHWEPFDKICWLWDTTNRFFLKSLQAMPAARTLTLSFDEVMNSETERFRDLFTLIDVRPPDMSDAREVLNFRHNSQSRNEFAEYDQWSDDQRSRLAKIAGGTMQQLGYE